MATNAGPRRPTYVIGNPDGTNVHSVPDSQLSTLASEPPAPLLPDASPPEIAAPTPRPDAPDPSTTLEEPPTARYADDTAPFIEPPSATTCGAPCFPAHLACTREGNWPPACR